MNREHGNKLDDKLSQMLSEAVCSESESSFPDRDAFQNWLEEGQHRRLHACRRKIRRTALTAAAVFLCVFLLSGSVLLLADSRPLSLQNLLTPEEGVAVPDNEQNIAYENGSIVIGGDGNGNVGTWTATFASYDDIPEKYQKEIIWFEDMPEGYELKNIKIARNLNNEEFLLIYLRESEMQILAVKQIKYLNNIENPAIVLNEYEDWDTLADGVYFKRTETQSIYSFVIDGGLVNVLDFAELDEKEIEAMIASAKTDWNMK